jgi:urea transport system permease protein
MGGPARAQGQEHTAADLDKAINELAAPDRQVQEAAIEAIGRMRDAGALPALTALRQGNLFNWTEGEKTRLVIVTEKISRPDGTEVVHLADARTDTPLQGPDGKPVEIELSNLKRVVATNALKQKIAPVLSKLSLASPDPKARESAAIKMGNDRNPDSIPFLEEALKHEPDRWVRHSIDEAIQMIRLTHASADVRLGAVKRLREIDGSNAMPFLREMVTPGADGQIPEKDQTVADAARSTIQSLESHESLTQAASTAFHVLSLSSVLMLVALGLAITFGLMGVINMAHGEMIMIGAYSTYVVQNLFIRYVPKEAFDYYFWVAIPTSFLTAGLLGLLIEWALLRFLYGRPLESLLCTWGVSLVLQQLVRREFGAANVDIVSPSFLAGGWQVMTGLVLPYNRLFIFVFSLLCLGGIYLLLSRSRAGLRIRAVTQNRGMSSCLGVATRRVDTLTFAMGTGIAGMAGCALSQLGTVGPGMGQNHIVDAFMVVVLGGVGKLMGTVVAAFGIGGFNKILEAMIGGALPKWGPILSKVVVLTLLILFLQKKPSGLFAMKGRHADV